MSKDMPREMGEAQRAYEAKRAAKAGVSLEKWMKQKDRDARARAAEARPAAASAPAAPRKPGLFGRLLGRRPKG